MKLREGKCLVQSHTASKWYSEVKLDLSLLPNFFHYHPPYLNSLPLNGGLIKVTKTYRNKVNF